MLEPLPLLIVLEDTNNTETNTYMSKEGKRICRACNALRVGKIIAAETPEQYAERKRKNMERHYANYDERKAKINAYAALHREEKRAYDVANRNAINARRRALAAERRLTSA